MWDQRLAHASKSYYSKPAGPLKVSSREIFQILFSLLLYLLCLGEVHSSAFRFLKLLHTDVCGPVCSQR